jgi:CDP-glycerol glycerophosphotransferase
MFSSYSGKEFSCNPKYIFVYLYRQSGEKLEYVWVLNNKILLPVDYNNIKVIRKNSFAYIIKSMRAKVYITNYGLSSYIPFRKSQIIIDTWHGGGVYKSSGAGVAIDTYKIYNAFVTKTISNEYTYFVSSSKIFSDRMSVYNFIDPQKYLSIGMPRNDILFSIKGSTYIETKRKLGIDSNTGVVLYAPTFRGEIGNPKLMGVDINIFLVTNALRKRFKKNFVFLIRYHQVCSREKAEESGVDVSMYPDMQQLLYMADVLISDYSSAMWDFSLTYKPCFVYAPDLMEYETERGFSVSPENWPYPITKSNGELEDAILNFDDGEYRKKVIKHHKDVGSYEDGKATEIICDLIAKNIG